MLMRNSLANLMGQLLYPVISLVLVPFYIHYLGLEGYGLVGLLSMLVAVLGIFSKGLGKAVQREIARRCSSDEHRPSLRRLVRTFEIIYWAVGGVLGIVLLTLSGVISRDWVKVHTVPPETVQICIALISLRIALAFPISIYQAVFIGSQRQVLGNVINSGWAITGSLFGFLVVLIWHSILGFYVVDMLNAILLTLVLRHWSGRVLPPKTESAPDRFDWGEFKALWAFSAALVWSHGIGLLFNQLDRIMISRAFPIATLGVYNVGMAGGRLLNMAYDPFLVAVYPQTCQLARQKHTQLFSAHLNRNAKVIMVLCMAVGMPMIFFSSEILQVWTRNALIARDGGRIMPIYVCSNILLTCASVLYAGQLAWGETKFGVQFNTVALVWFPATMWLLVKHVGLTGAAWAWLIFCALLWLFHTTATFILMLKCDGIGSYARSIILIALAGFMVCGSMRYLAMSIYPDQIWGRMLFACIGGLLAFCVCYLLAFGLSVPSEMAALLRRIRPAPVSDGS